MRNIFITIAALLTFAAVAAADTCVDCHSELTPGIVTDWKLSKHSENDISCSACHGEGHQSADDVAKVGIPTPEICATCHDTQVEQFSAGTGGRLIAKAVSADYLAIRKTDSH